MPDMKLQDIKLTDQVTGHENARHEISGHENTEHEFARHDKYRMKIYYTMCNSQCAFLLNFKTFVFSCPVTWSVNFMFCNFMSGIFSQPKKTKEHCYIYDEQALHTRRTYKSFKI